MKLKLGSRELNLPISNDFPNYIRGAQKFIEFATQEGIDTYHAKKLLDGAKRAFTQDKPKRAVILANMAKKDARRRLNTRDLISIKVSYANKSIQKVERNIVKARQLGLDLLSPQKLLYMAKEARSNRNYELSISCLKEAEQAINNSIEKDSKIHQTEDLLHGAGEIIGYLRDHDMDFIESEDIFSSAKHAFDSNEYLDSQILAMKAVKSAIYKVTEVKRKYIPPPPPKKGPVVAREAAVAIEAPPEETYIKEIDEGPVTDLEEVISEMTPEVIPEEELPVIQLGEEKKVKQLISIAFEIVKKGEESGLDIKEAENRLIEAKAALNRKDYETAIEIATEIREIIEGQMAEKEEIIKEPEYVSDIDFEFQDLNDLKEIFDEMEVEIEDLDIYLNDIKKLIFEKDVSSAYELSIKTHNALENVFKEMYDLDIINDYRSSNAVLFYPQSDEKPQNGKTREYLTSLDKNDNLSQVVHRPNNGDYIKYTKQVLSYILRNGTFKDKTKIFVYVRSISFQESEPILVVENYTSNLLGEKRFKTRGIVSPEIIINNLPEKLKQSIYIDETNSMEDIFGYSLVQKSVEILKNLPNDARISILNLIANRQFIDKGLLSETIEEIGSFQLGALK